jgi:transcriptional regulator with XRE-family HTH domain
MNPRQLGTFKDDLYVQAEECVVGDIGENILGERLREARERAGMTQTGLAARVNVRPQTIQSIESGRIRKSRYLPEIASTLGVSIGWLMGVENFVERRKDYRRVPLLQACEVLDANVSVSLGVRRADKSWNEAAESEIVCGSLRDIGADAFAVTINDAGMVPTLQPGDRVIVDPAEPLRPGCIVLAIIHGAAVFRTLKVAELQDDGSPAVIELVPANSLYPAVRTGPPFGILGVAVEVRRHL